MRHATLRATVVILLFCSASVLGGSYTNKDGAWSAGASWDPAGGPPGANDDAYIPNISQWGTSLNADMTISNLYIVRTIVDDCGLLTDGGTRTLTVNGTVRQTGTGLYSIGWSDARRIILDGLCNVDVAAGTLRFFQANTYSGGTVISNGGMLTIQNSGAMGSGSVTVKTNGTLNINIGGGGTVSKAISMDGGSTLKLLATTLTGGITANGNVTLGITYASGAIRPKINSSITESSPSQVSVVSMASGQYEIEFAASNSYSGGTIVQTNVIIYTKNPYALGTAGTVLVQPGARVLMNDANLVNNITLNGGVFGSCANIAVTHYGTLTLLQDSFVQADYGNCWLNGQIYGDYVLTHTNMNLPKNLNFNADNRNSWTGNRAELVVAAQYAVAETNGCFGGANIKVITGGYYWQRSYATNAISDTATVTLQGSGIMYFEAGVNDSIGILVMDGTNYQSGTFGSSSSAAATKNDTHFAGSGMLTVLGIPQGGSIVIFE